nr:hypothetical protein [Tanacetum cinerariifolium]
MANETKKNGASRSVVDENRGQDDARQHPKKRGTSKDVVASLDKRVAGVETSMVELKNQVEGLEGLGSDFESMREDFRVALNTLSGDLRREIHDLRDLFMGEITKIREEFGEEVSILHQTIEDLQVDVALCKRSLASGGGNTNHRPKLDVPKPSPAVYDFLWEMEQYLEGVNVVDDASKIKMATRYLKDTASNSFRRILKTRRRVDFVNSSNPGRYGTGGGTRQKPRDQMVNHEKGGGDKNAQLKVDHARKPPTRKDKSMKTNYKSGGCFICDGPHRARDFPKKASLNEMSAHEDEDASNDESMASMRILNAIKAKTEVPKVIAKGLQYVEATINGIKVRALVDTGATHNFVAVDEAERLGINATKGSGTIKAVYSPAKPIHGVAKDAWAKIGEWEGTIDLLVVPMDDFIVVLGLEFLDKDAKSGSKTLSAMQFKKGFNKNEPCYLAVTRLETDEGSSKVELPPRREVDHTIELESGSKPPAKAPYRMPLPELEELRKQLKELMDAGYIRPSKAPYGEILHRVGLEIGVLPSTDSRGRRCQDDVCHEIKDRGLMMDDAKIEAIQEWEPPTKVTELRSFLGLVNYYQRFIMGYSAIASPLMDLLRKNQAWIWDEECQATFESLKKAVMEEPVLRLPDVTMPFKLHTDASDFAIGGVLMQDGHPIAFESRKLNETERKYTVQEKEITAVVHCLRIWRHYLLGLRFVIKTDNIAMSYFQTQNRLSPKQARWQDFLAEFDYQLEYKPGKANVEGLEHDPLAKKIVALAKDWKTRRFWLKGDMLFTKGDQLYVPKWGDLRRIILKECHDSKWVGHPRIKRTLALVEGTYYWPRMEDDVETFGPWESVSMDFITCLPKSEGSWIIIVVVDRFSKYETFIAAPPDVMADDTAKLFFKNVVKVVQDHGGGFELIHEFSSPNRRANGEGKRTIGALSSALWKSPFELVTGRQPLTPNALAASYEGSSPAAYKTIKEWHEQANMAWASLDKATKRMKKWADEKRRHVEFEVGDQVMVKLLPQQFKSLRKVHKGLIRRFLKPYHGDEEDPERGVSKRVPIAVVTLYDREVEEILSDHMIRIRGVPSYKEYLIKWRDLPDSEASWEAEDLLWQFADEIKRYYEDGTTRTSRA